MTNGLGKALQHQHDLTVDGPMPEGLDLASAGSIPKHLAHLAMQAAAAGHDAPYWRATAIGQVPGVTPEVTANAERFMRESGLWPWAQER